ncbi:hypothetical protein [Neorhizobium galegae]|uniref:hypothetical protein n=1 Tax=Neorhizobium galegae TaxID=399 RepID=UPI001F361606|nr:hypothetical protein [Neorhizobium galegae]UIK05013.1 hypothetical protein LZK81_20550 [Neorhizobium galegae]
MKKSHYMTRALRAQDPRYSSILGKLGYERTDVQAGAAVPDITALRAEYHRVLGKRPFNGWDAETLAAKIAEAKG